MVDRVDQQLGNYRLVRLLGQGGFADVYLGEHVYLETQAAIKVLQTQLAREDMEQFRLEARTIARLEHPHIVRVLDFGVEERTPFLVMSYAPNGTLRTRHPKGTRVPLSTVVSYVQQIEAHPRPASDQYSLGIVVYEWLSGDRPFHGSFIEVAVKHSTVPPPSLCEKVPTLSPAVEQVVMTALAVCKPLPGHWNRPASQTN